LKRERLAINMARSLALSPDGEWLAAATGLTAPQFFLWNWRTEKPRLVKDRLKAGVVGFSSDGKLFAVSLLPSGRLQVWDLATRRVLCEGEPLANHLVARAPLFSPDGKTLFVPLLPRTGAGPGKTALLDPATGQSQGFIEGASPFIALS